MNDLFRFICEAAELSRQNDAIKSLGNEEINLTEIARSYMFRCEVDRLQNALNKDRKDHQREKELMLRDFQQKFYRQNTCTMNMNHYCWEESILFCIQTPTQILTLFLRTIIVK